MIFYMALRNITRNRKNNIIIAFLVAVITFLFFIGNSVMGMMDRGIRKAYIESLTGDVVLEKTGDVTMNFFGANTPVIDSFFTIPVLPYSDEIMKIISAENGIEGVTRQVSGKAYMDFLNVREPVLLCGVDPQSYFPLFTGIILTEGDFLRPGEYGAMITEERAKRIETLSGQRPLAGMPLLLTSAGATGFKIREVPLTGIFKYKNPGQFMNEIVIADPQTVRALNSIQAADSGSVNSGEDTLRLLRADPDDLFSEAFASGYEGGGDKEETEETGFSAALLENYLKEAANDGHKGTIEGGWNFIMLRLKKGVSSGSFISSLNKKIQPYGVTAVNWRVAAGNSALLSLLVQVLYNSGLFLVCVAGLITVINMLLITVFRRTREIGTLRAIGAPDIYIRSLMFCENFIIAIVAGFAGIIGGLVFMFWVNSLGLHITNELIVSIMGSPVLRLEFLPQAALVSFFMAVLFSLVSSIYPVEVTVRIAPIAAVQRG
jgi:ABC-type lipoprotein release transport system permease subunit